MLCELTLENKVWYFYSQHIVHVCTQKMNSQFLKYLTLGGMGQIIQLYSFFHTTTNIWLKYENKNISEYTYITKKVIQGPRLLSRSRVI